MKKRTVVFESGGATLALICTAAVFVTVIGYFDEGNYRIFAGFWDYLASGGIPPLSDYILWAVIFAVLGTALFHAQSIVPALQKAFAVRLLVSVLAIPIFILGLLAFLAAAYS